jgi:chalcone and stilbene synthase-like protein
MGLTLLLQGKPEAAMPYELWVSGLPQRPPRVWRRRATYPQLLHHLKGHRVPSRFVLEFDWRSLRLDEGWPRTARGPAHHVQTAFADPAIIPDHRKRVRRGRVLAALDSALPTRDRGMTPGGRSILDALGEGLGLGDDVLSYARKVLRRFGYMSSATIMFVLKSVLQAKSASGLGWGMAFGPGIAGESVIFELAAQSGRGDRWRGCEAS